MGDTILLICALLNIGIALLHVYIIFAGAPAYRFFGAGEWMASQAERGSVLPALITWLVTGVFVGFSIYCLAGADIVLLPVPWLLYGLIAIAALYTLRGVAIIPVLIKGYQVTRFDHISSYSALLIGVLHTAGVYLYYRDTLG